MIKDIATTIHLLHCDKPHASNWDSVASFDTEGYYGEGVCCWYLEDQLENCWNEPDHKQYLIDAEIFVRLIMEDPTEEFDDEDIVTATKILYKIAEICSRISFLTSEVKGIDSIIRKAIEKVLS